MKGWRLVVLLCTTLLCESVRSLDKWSRPDTAEKRIDDWVPITASCPSCNKNLEPNEDSNVDEIGSLLNPPAVPSGRSFNFNAKQNNFKRAPAGEPYEITTPSAPLTQFFNQQHSPKIPQSIQFPVSFFNQQNPFQSRFQGVPNFQPQFTFIPQPQIQPAPKENKVTFPESPFIQQQNKGSVQLVYVPIEALQRQKPRFQADRPVPQQSQLEVKTQSPFETGKLKFQRPPQPFDPSRFPNSQQFEQDPNRFAPPPPPTSFEQDIGRFPPPSQLFEQEKPTFPSQLKETRPEFLPQNEQPVAPQSYQFVEDARNPPSNFFQFHDNRFQKPSIEEGKAKEPKPQVKPTFVPNIDGTRQESIQSFTSNFDGNRPRQEPPQNFQTNFQETRPRKEQQPQNFQQNFQETKPRPEPQLQNFQPNFQETRPRKDPRPQNNQPSFQETKPRQETFPQSPPPQFIPKFEPQQEFIPNFQESRPRPESPQIPSQQFIPKFEDSKLAPQQQFIPDFQEISQQQLPQQIFSPDFESLRPKPEVVQNFVPNFQETIPKQESQEAFVPHFEEVKPKLNPKVELTLPSTPTPQETFSLPSSTEQITPSTSYPPPHQPPLSVYMEKRLDNKINEVLTILKDAKTIPVLDTIGNRSPKVFVGPTDLDAPRGYVKFELPYLSSLDINKIDSMGDRLPFFVAPLNFKPPFGYAKIPFPPPHIGSVVVSSKSSNVPSSTEFVPFTLTMTSQLPTEVNSLQPSLSSTTQRGTERPQKSTDATTTSTPKRNRQRKPLHRGTLSSFSTSTPLNDITERKRDHFTTPAADLQRLTESSPSVSEQPQFSESTPTPVRHKFSRKPVEHTTVFETTQVPIQQQQQFDNSQQQQFNNPQQQQFNYLNQENFENPKQQQSENPDQQQFNNQQQQQFNNLQQQQFNNPEQQQFDNINQQHFDSPKQHQFENPKQQTFDNLNEQQFNSPKQQQFDNVNQPQFDNPNQPQFDSPNQPQFDNPKQKQFDNLQQQKFDSKKQQQFDNPQQQFFADQQVPQTQSDYLNSSPQVTQSQFFNNQQQQPSQQTFFENVQSPSQQSFVDSQPLPSQQPFFENQQFLENSPQTLQEQVSNTPQSFTDHPQFISSSTEKQIFKNFQQIQPLSQYQVGNNFLNQQQSSTEQIQSASNPPQTVSIEPQTVATVSPTDTPKFRQRLSYYDKLLMSSTQAPAIEYTSAQNFIETSEKPRERTKLRPRQRTTTTRKPTTESPMTPEEVSEQVTVESSTQRYNPLKRRRPTTTTTTTEQTEVTRNPLRSRTTQAGRSDFVRSRSRRPTTTTTTTTTVPTTTTTEEVRVQQLYEDVNNAQVTGLDEQKKIEEAASFWNEPVTIQQSQGYELDTRYTQPPNAGGLDLRFAEPPTAEEESSNKENKYTNEKKAHDPNSEKKGPGRRGHWVRVRVKKPQDNLDTAESQNSLGPLSVNAVRELVTKPTHEFSSAAAELTTTAPVSEPNPVTPQTTTTTAATTTTTTTEVPPTTTAAAFTSVVPLTTIDYASDGAVATEEHSAETTTVLLPPLSPEQQQQTGAKYPDDEQDEAFQRNLADMLAKFIGDGGNQQPQESTATVQADESTAETQYAGSDAEPTVTPPTAAAPVTDAPVAPITSTTTKVSMETEICYKGRCVKSKKNKQITDLVSEP
ncbi:Hypothetical protein CINCED_3A017474 [Cinara cedri]|uniref:Uncharacterized protein n=1 Tax=Cinara cedri TaxID=506608 RepID=A0A5E4MAL7_9HEMI|nr:Hypothetical protein CINCED_3A017474 [Cinara cedri]